MLPQNVFSSCIVLWLASGTSLTSLKQLSPCNGCMVGFGNRFVTAAFYSVLALLTACGVQTILAYYLFQSVRRADGDLGSDCSGTSFTLRCVALAVFVLVTLQNFLEVHEMHLWLSLLPTAKSHEVFKVQEVAELIKPTHLAQPGRDGTLTGTRLFLAASGVTVTARCVFYALLLIPSTLITSAILVAGSGAVLCSDNDFDIILNSVAAVFVLDLDDIIYKLLTPKMLQAVGRVPPLITPILKSATLARAKFRLFLVGSHTFCILFFEVLLSLPLYYGWCSINGQLNSTENTS